ncbi:MAG: hypothetical protein SGPRY_007831 [Prymnesium sp.]
MYLESQRQAMLQLSAGCSLCGRLAAVVMAVVLAFCAAASTPEAILSGLPASLQTVFHSSSANLTEEIEFLASRLLLRPGMTYCEMGSADGTFLARLAPQVMPGGLLYATAPGTEELSATRMAADEVGVGDALTTLLATDEEWAPGIPSRSCDVLFSRMVYHMIPQSTILKYIPQWTIALKPGGLLFISDHNPSDGKTGPRRPISCTLGVCRMDVVPQSTEVDEITAGGFVLFDGPFDYPFFDHGYAATYILPNTSVPAASQQLGTSS